MLNQAKLASDLVALGDQMNSRASTDNPMSSQEYADKMAEIIHNYVSVAQLNGTAGPYPVVGGLL